jgi:hypothetical protein
MAPQGRLTQAPEIPIGNRGTADFGRNRPCREFSSLESMRQAKMERVWPDLHVDVTGNGWCGSVKPKPAYPAIWGASKLVEYQRLVTGRGKKIANREYKRRISAFLCWSILGQWPKSAIDGSKRTGCLSHSNQAARSRIIGQSSLRPA